MVKQRQPMADYYNSWKFTEGGAYKKCPGDIFSDRARRRAGLDGLSQEAQRIGKETGLYYFGARYYQPSWSIPALSQVEGWLSVDPMLEEMPEWTPYHYVFNNPLNLVDPDGMKPNGGWPPNLFGYGGVSIVDFDFKNPTLIGGLKTNNIDLNLNYGKYLTTNLRLMHEHKQQTAEGGINSFVKLKPKATLSFNFDDSEVTFGINMKPKPDTKSNLGDYANSEMAKNFKEIKKFSDPFKKTKNNTLSIDFNNDSVDFFPSNDSSNDFSFDTDQYIHPNLKNNNTINNGNVQSQSNNIKLTGFLEIDSKNIPVNLNY